MNDRAKTNNELIKEISVLKQRIQEQEKAEAERKREEEALRESEEKYRILVSESPDPIFSFTPEGQYMYVNRAFAEGVGKPVEDIIGKTMWDVFPKEEADKRFASLSQVFRTGKEKAIEVRVPRADGDRYYMTTITPIKDTKGKMLSVVCSSKDITERKKAEEKLKAAEETYRNIFLNAQTGLFRTDMNTGLILDANDCVARFIGYKDREELLSKPFNIAERYVDPKDRERIIFLLKEHGEFKNFETRFRRNDGSIIWLRYSAMIIPDKGWMEGVSEDITKEKDAGEALRESEEKLSLVMDGVPALLTYIDADLRFVYMNKAYADWYGRTRADLIGKRICDLLDEEVFRRALPHYQMALSGKYVIFENKTFDKEGQERFVSVRLVPHYSGGLITGFFASIMDISERKRAEEERNRLQERLQRAEKMEALGTLAGGVAHDLNNVLGILVGYSELLLYKMPADSSLRSHVEKIINGGVRAAAIVQDLLTLARRGVHSESVVNMNSIIADFQKTPEFENLCASHSRIRIKTDLAADLLNIKGSPPHISKTFMNLLNNAVEAMPEGGLVTVTTGNRHLDRPVHGYDDLREGDYVLLSVSDEGVGIPDTDIKHIFEPFYTKKVMGRSGTGLGLAVVWGTVKDHGGYIDVQTEKGKGTTLTLYFPVTREEMTLSPAAIPLSEYSGNDESILVVDDIKEQRELAAEMLGTLNYRVNTVSSGEEAVEYLKYHQVDLIVLDMIMHPGMDGLDTYKRILEIHPKQKAIIVSGFSESDRVHAAQSLGAGAYVRKPYVIEKLGMVARRELDRST